MTFQQSSCNIYYLLNIGDVMLKRTLILLFTIALFITQAHSETLEEIIANNIKAHGGKDQYEKIKTSQMNMNIDLIAMSIPTTMYVKEPDKMRIEMTVKGQSAITIFNGDKGWILKDGKVKEIPQDIFDQIKEQIEGRSNYLNNIFIDYEENGIDIKLEGTENIDDKDYYKLIVTTKEGKITTIYIDSQTYLEYKINTSQNLMGQDAEMEVFLKDNKWVEGLLIPFKMEIFSEGNLVSSVILKDIKLNLPIEDSMFLMSVD